MQAAFLGGFVLPPPASGAEVFTQTDGAGAGGAANAGVKLVVQRVVSHVVELDVMPNVTPGPVGQRIEFDGFALCQFGFIAQRHVGAGARLFTAQAGDPGFFAFQGTLQRLHLADAAAGFAQGYAFVHGVFAFP